MLDWVLDLLVACLLIATIAYCAVLHRRLALLGQDRDELARFIDAFDRAVRRADAAVGDLGRAGEQAAARLAGPADAAKRLADELRLLIERGERLAGGLAAGGEAARDAAAAPERNRRLKEPGADELRRVLEALR